MPMLALAAPPPIVAPAPPARMLVFADEFRYGASRRVVPAGRPLLLQLKNIGEDDHDLRIVGPRGGVRARTGIVAPGGLGRIRVRLPRGRFTYFCTVADHAALGMRGSLLVKRPARRGRR